MLGREKLEYHIINAEDFYEAKVYLKEEVDRVMDAMERRIARLFNLVAGYQRNSLGLSAMYNRRLDSELERIQELEAENEQLKAELQQTATSCNKLKCLALHLFDIVANKEASAWAELNECLALSRKSHIYKGHEYRWLRIAKKCREEHRKVKAKLMEGR